MTASSDLTVRQQRIVEALRPFFGTEADALYEAHGCWRRPKTDHLDRSLPIQN